MKILITTDTYRPTINGVVTSIESLKKALNRLGHDVRILTFSDSFNSKKRRRHLLYGFFRSWEILS